MKKNAFTFAELMISLVVISVLCAILYPMIAQFTPNSNKPLFKAAYRTLIEVLAELTADSISGELEIVAENGTRSSIATGAELCTVFCDKTNTVPLQTGGTSTAPVFEASDCATQCADQIITTTNGMRWHFGNYATYRDPMDNATNVANVFKIYVDVNASNNSLPSAANCISPIDAANGEFCYAPAEIYEILPGASDNDGVMWPNGKFIVEKLKAQDTFEILIDKKGKIVSMSPAGWANLEDNLQAVD